MKALLICALALLGTTVLFWDTAVGMVSLLALIYTGILIIGRLIMPPGEPLDIDWKKIRKAAGKVLIAAAYLFFIGVMIYNWPSVGSKLIFCYLVVRVICLVAVRLIIRGHSPLHVDYEYTPLWWVAVRDDYLDAKEKEWEE